MDLQTVKELMPWDTFTLVSMDPTLLQSCVVFEIAVTNQIYIAQLIYLRTLRQVAFMCWILLYVRENMIICIHCY